MSVADERSIRIDTHDVGKAPTDAFGRDSREFAMRVDAEHLTQMRFEPLKDKYAENASVVDDFAEYCKARRIAFSRGFDGHWNEVVKPVT
ncbi:MAG: hypothetical protein AAGH57_10180 [Pseudomonadota bacterium]